MISADATMPAPMLEYLAKSPDILNRAKIARLRFGLKLTQTEAAKRADMQVSQWNQIETGRYGVTLATLWKVAQVLKVDPRELLKGPKGKPPS